MPVAGVVPAESDTEIYKEIRYTECQDNCGDAVACFFDVAIIFAGSIRYQFKQPLMGIDLNVVIAVLGHIDIRDLLLLAGKK